MFIKDHLCQRPYGLRCTAEMVAEMVAGGEVLEHIPATTVQCTPCSPSLLAKFSFLDVQASDDASDCPVELLIVFPIKPPRASERLLSITQSNLRFNPA